MLATFHLHYQRHKIKYGNLEIGNTTQQLLSTTWSYCRIASIESFLFWVILVRYRCIYIYIYIYIYIWKYIYKVSYIHSFFVMFNWMFFLHCMLNILWHGKIFCENDESIARCHDPSNDAIFLGVYSESIFPVLEYFFLWENCVPFWSPCALLIAKSISLDTSSKPTVGFFLKLFLRLE